MPGQRGATQAPKTVKGLTLWEMRQAGSLAASVTGLEEEAGSGKRRGGHPSSHSILVCHAA